MTDHYGHHLPKNLPTCYAAFYCPYQRRIANCHRYRLPRCKWKHTCNQQRNHPWLTMEEWVSPYLTEEVLNARALEKRLW